MNILMTYIARSCLMFIAFCVTFIALWYFGTRLGFLANSDARVAAILIFTAAGAVSCWVSWVGTLWMHRWDFKSNIEGD